MLIFNPPINPINYLHPHCSRYYCTSRRPEAGTSVCLSACLSHIQLVFDIAAFRNDETYRFVSQGVPVGSEEGGLRSQEGPRHAIPGGRRLFLQLALERGHLEEYMEQECEAERSRQKGG